MLMTFLLFWSPTSTIFPHKRRAPTFKRYHQYWNSVTNIHESSLTLSHQHHCHRNRLQKFNGKSVRFWKNLFLQLIPESIENFTPVWTIFIRSFISKSTSSLAYKTISQLEIPNASDSQAWNHGRSAKNNIASEREYKLDLCFQMVSMNVKVSALQSIETPAPSNDCNPALSNPNRINKYTIRNVVNWRMF